MGGAVSGALGGVMAAPGKLLQGDIGGALSGITGGALGGFGDDTANLVKSLIPDIPIADQTALQYSINGARQLANNQIDKSNELQNTARAQLGTVQNAIGQTQGSINNAQGLNNGGNVSAALGLLGGAANGMAPSAAQAQLQSGKDQAIATQMAMANSGNLSQQISGQKTAMDNAANLTQQAANQSAQLRANEMANARGQYAGAAAQQAGQAAQNAGLQQGQAAQQAGLYGDQLSGAQNYAGLANGAIGTELQGQTSALQIEQDALGKTGENRARAVAGLLDGGGKTAAALASDENLKKNIEYSRADKAKAISASFGPRPEKEEEESEKTEYKSPKKSESKWSGEAQSRSESIRKSFMSDEDMKKDISKTDKMSAFLDAIDPVSFEYKESTGDMGRTPGEHLGVIAQQIEKAPGGKAMIVETPEGKGIDLASAVGTLLAAAAHSHGRIEELEDLFKSKRKEKK